MSDDSPGTSAGSLDSAQALQALGSASLGRTVFTPHALPAVRPVNHVLDDGGIVIRIHEGAALAFRSGCDGASGAVTAHWADAIDPDTRLGRSATASVPAREETPVAHDRSSRGSGPGRASRTA
ncbi:pyridoxamine 5'-phosphate oxidase family protein [Streptomyces sp. NPDC058964]|uniref:pyridoxamine 5'-phosphate oxidase family protein n=1 Tax=Streptomyces sp. NPDC058964 TaxID=3346681 RepID=UPI0036A70A14